LFGYNVAKVDNSQAGGGSRPEDVPMLRQIDSGSCEYATSPVDRTSWRRTTNPPVSLIVELPSITVAYVEVDGGFGVFPPFAFVHSCILHWAIPPRLGI
jgi:hypothetical protein